MQKRFLLAMVAAALALGQPSAAHAANCEDYCGEQAAANCENIDSYKCAFYILGCLGGCSVAQIIDALT